MIHLRLGAFGWLSPPNVTDLDANIGLHDSLAAMEWVEKYIHRFGGDKGKTTVMGISAGGGVIMHTIISNGGEGKKLPFQQVCLSIPLTFQLCNWRDLPNITISLS